MGLLRSGSQLRLRRVYTEQSECARNGNMKKQHPSKEVKKP